MYEEMTVMQALVAAGVPKDEMHHHESDLYVPVTSVSEKVVEAWYGERGLGRRFRSVFTDEVTGVPTFDLPFAFDPYWVAHGAEPLLASAGRTGGGRYGTK